VTIGWMIIATLPDGQTKAMPTSPEVLDNLPVNLHAALPTLGGVWADEADATTEYGKIPLDMRDHFEVVPVSITRMVREV